MEWDGLGWNEMRCNEMRKEGNVLFNDALNTFYFSVIWCRTYSDSERKPTADTMATLSN